MIDIASLPDDLARNIWKVYISKYVIHHIAFARWGYSDTFDVSTYDALPLYRNFFFGKVCGKRVNDPYPINYQQLEEWSDYDPYPAGNMTENRGYHDRYIQVRSLR